MFSSAAYTVVECLSSWNAVRYTATFVVDAPRAGVRTSAQGEGDKPLLLRGKYLFFAWSERQTPEHSGVSDWSPSRIPCRALALSQAGGVAEPYVCHRGCLYTSVPGPLVSGPPNPLARSWCRMINQRKDAPSILEPFAFAAT